MPEPLPIVVGGTIAIDNVKTPFSDETELLGGSAAYAALASSFYHSPVHLVGIVGKDGGYTNQVADACVLIPVVSQERITPHTEGLAAVVWHLLVSHPRLLRTAMKWASMPASPPGL